MTSSPNRMRRIARILWLAPFVLVIPTWYVIANYVPDRANGSIADGFRKLNIMLQVISTVTLVCWLPALTLTACADVPTLSRPRLLLLIFFVLIILFFVATAVWAVLEYETRNDEAPVSTSTTPELRFPIVSSIGSSIHHRVAGALCKAEGPECLRTRSNHKIHWEQAP